MSTIRTENFDGVTAPALPSGFVMSGSWATSTAVAVSTPNCLLSSTAGSTAVYEYATADNASGETAVSAAIRISNSTPVTGRLGLVYLRSASGSTTFSSATHYEARIYLSSTSGPAFKVQLDRPVSGAATVLGSEVTIPSYTGGAFLRLYLAAHTNGAAEVDIAVCCQRVSDSMWLTAAGAWQSAQADCINYADTSASRILGPGYAGIATNQPTTASLVQFDDFLLESTVAATSIAVSYLLPNRVFQRTGTTAGQGSASIPIIGSYSGTPAAIEARWNGGTWQTITASPSGGTFIGTLTAQNVQDNATTPGQGALEVHFTDNTSISASVASVGIGDIYFVLVQYKIVCVNDLVHVYQAPSSRTCFKVGLCRERGSWGECLDHTFNSTTDPGVVGLGF